MSLVEDIAALEHDQWVEWAKSLMENEDLSEDRVERWEGFMVPYEKLSEEDKESDREYAQKVVDLLKSKTSATRFSLEKYSGLSSISLVA